MTIDEYDALLSEQNHRCAICRRPEITERKGTLMRLSVDHDHTTGQNRGLLCNNCNRAVGLFGDNAEILEAAINYLNGWSMRPRRQLALNS